MGRFTKNIVLYLLIIAAFVIAIDAFSGQSANKSELSYTGFIQQVQQKKVESVTITNDHGIKGKLKNGTEFNSYAPTDETLIKTLQDNGVEITAAPPEQPAWWMSLLGSAIPIIILVVLFFFIMQQTQGGGGRVMNFGKSRAKLMGEGNVKVSFKDVAGAEEAKQELEEVVEFLKDPGKFTTIGAKIPKGVLLAGPPGTGKTLLAKAVAGEAGVPFFTISGSDFVEMFVGVGASRVRDLFTQAKKNAPCIIFIDEIDAVGRQRGAGMGGGHDEREQTLNQLLVEMDGFDGNEGVIVIAATNRSDVLDPALLRPGRFDRQILVGRPDVKGREAILRVHARNKPLSDDVDLKVVAQQTPGFAGADLENVLNEAALVAARRNKKKIDASDIDEAEDRVIAGPAKKDRVINKKEREMVAYHEAGHTIVGLVLSRARVVHKVTIIPRGRAGGYMIALPKEDQFLMTKEDMFEQIVGLLGGRTAEEIIFGVQSTGASNDFEQATALARSMVTEYGMSDKLGPVQYEGNHQVFVGRDYGQTKAYSEQVAFEIDQEVRRILMEAHQKAHEIIEEHRAQHKLIAEKLLEYETLDAKAIKSLFEEGKMPAGTENSEYPSEKAQTFEEAKRALEEKDAEKQAAEKKDFDQQVDELRHNNENHEASSQDKTEDGQE